MFLNRCLFLKDGALFVGRNIGMVCSWLKGAKERNGRS